MKVIDEIAEELENLPDVEELDITELEALLERVRNWKGHLDAHEPKNPDTQSYEDWCEMHEELEDIEDDILERIED